MFFRLWARQAYNLKVVSEANGRAEVNDGPGDCQSREVTDGKFSAENLYRPLVQILPPQPTMRTDLDVGARNPVTWAVTGFFYPIFSSETG